MSVGHGRIERRVLKVLKWHRNWRQVNRPYDKGQPDILSVKDIVWDIQYGCREDYPDGAVGPSNALYQSACRAVRSLERKGIVKTGRLLTAWEEGWSAKTVTLVDDRTQHLRTIEKDIGVNV